MRWTVAALDGATNRLRLFEARCRKPHRRANAPCATFRSASLAKACASIATRAIATLYAFALGGGGEIAQYMISARDAGYDATPGASAARGFGSQLLRGGRRQLAISMSPSKASGFGALTPIPEAEVVPHLIDAARIGHVTGEAGGIAVYNAGAASYLVASDASANHFHVYDRNADHRLRRLVCADASGRGRWRRSRRRPERHELRLRRGFPARRAARDGRRKRRRHELQADLVGGDRGRAELGRRHAARSARRRRNRTWRSCTRRWRHAPVETDGDSADDPAIWVDRNNPSRSIIIGTQKQSGLYVYDLQGRVLQFLPDGRMNNVDLRDNFSARRTDAFRSSRRATAPTIASRSIASTPPRAGSSTSPTACSPRASSIPTASACIRARNRASTYVFVTDSNGPVRQWELIDAGNGRVRANRVRDIPFATQTEGCVADDATGVLYVGEEDVGLWRVGAEPDAPATPVSIATVEGNEALKDDIEGIGLYDLGDGRGYLVLSSQGNNTYAVFRREGEQRVCRLVRRACRRRARHRRHFRNRRPRSAQRQSRRRPTQAAFSSRRTAATSRRRNTRTSNWCRGRRSRQRLAWNRATLEAPCCADAEHQARSRSRRSEPSNAPMRSGSKRRRSRVSASSLRLAAQARSFDRAECCGLDPKHRARPQSCSSSMRSRR